MKTFYFFIVLHIFTEFILKCIFKKPHLNYTSNFLTTFLLFFHIFIKRLKQFAVSSVDLISQTSLSYSEPTNTRPFRNTYESNTIKNKGFFFQLCW